MLLTILSLSSLGVATAFWDIGTSTAPPERIDKVLRRSFFRWQRAESTNWSGFFPNIDWNDQNNRWRLSAVAGISIDMIPLSTAAILNKRILLTAANYLTPYMDRQMDLRIWALGRAGLHTTPYRYRVWRVWRLFSISNNPEHQHGPRGEHVPRHDVAVIISRDQLYIYYRQPHAWQYSYFTTLTEAHWAITKTQVEDQDKLLFAGSGFEYMLHVKVNYKIYFALPKEEHIVDCSKYLPKWWGKFICIKNVMRYSGVQNGGPLFMGRILIGIGCFEIRYNEDRILVFTDLRYFVHWIKKYAHIYPGQYYEYAYPQWSQKENQGWLHDGNVNHPYIPIWQKSDSLHILDMIPLSTAAILNKRILLTAANYLTPYMDRQMDLRIWALGRAGLHTTPYRYRVWRVWRLFSISNNPEHQHGPRGEHVPRHDVAVIISRDQLYIYYRQPHAWQYSYFTTLTEAHWAITTTQVDDQDKLLFAGSGFEYMLHVKENYKIYFALPKEEHIVDCSKYLPKWWGKFICIKNVMRYSGVQNGGPLFMGRILIGIGCFEIRYNEDRILVFTDLRYYVHWIRKYAHIYPGQYYEYAYPQWSQKENQVWLHDGNINHPYIPIWQKADNLHILGK